MALDQLTAGGNADAAKNPLRLAEENLLRRKINVGTQVFDLSVGRLSIGVGRQRQCDLSIANIDRVEEWLSLQKRAVIYIERQPADLHHGVLTMPIIENANILRDEAAERIEREPPDGGFDTMLAQFFHHQRAPGTAEAFFGQIPAPASKGAEREHNDEADTSIDGAPPERPSC